MTATIPSMPGELVAVVTADDNDRCYLQVYETEGDDFGRRMTAAAVLVETIARDYKMTANAVWEELRRRKFEVVLRSVSSMGAFVG